MRLFGNVESLSALVNTVLARFGLINSGLCLE